MEKNLKTINLIETYIEKGEEAACLLIIEIYNQPIKLIIDRVLKERGFTDKIIEAANTDFFAHLFLNIEKVIVSSSDLTNVIFDYAIYFLNKNYVPEERHQLFEKVEKCKKYDVLPELLKFLLIDKHINNLTEKEIAEKYDWTIEQVLKKILNAELVADNFCLN